MIDGKHLWLFFFPIIFMLYALLIKCFIKENFVDNLNDDDNDRVPVSTTHQHYHHFQTSSKPTNRRSGDDSNSSSRNGNGIGSRLPAAAATGPRRHRVDGMFFHFIYLLHEYGWGPGTNGGSRRVAS